jgi:membrane glycosyltransferase
MDAVNPNCGQMQWPVEAWLRRQALWRRTLFFGLTLLTASTGSFLMLEVLETEGLTPLALASFVMFIVLFTWIAGAFWTAVFGFAVRLIGGDPAVLQRQQVAGQALHGRTAIIVPIYNEDTARVFAGIAATWDSLLEQPQQGYFDLFVLSDTRRPEIAAAEESAWRALVQRFGAPGRIFYRRRAQNTGRKSGNIAEFVSRWGGAYEHMLVFDADSVMSGRAIVSLAQLMQAHPEVGIIQALPLLAGRDTLFARLLQFATRLSGPMFASGLAFWQLGEGNYWGHNAIIRVRPFAEHCALPRLPGKGPFGGEILSHDIVEAAFMRSAGYKIWLVPDIEGSWEEIPSNVIDYAARDRRWAQGNLQHIGVLPLRGLHWLSRVHMLTGILSYLTSPLWLLVLVVSSILTCLQAATGHQYFQPGTYSLFPAWPQYRDTEIIALLSMTVVVLIVPKLLGACLILKDPQLRRSFGGTAALLRSVVLEQLLSMLLAPVMMLFHSSFVVRALFGRGVSWDSQPRADRGLTWREAFIRHAWHVVLGAVWAAAIMVFAPAYIWWMLPVIAGMLLSVPFSVLTSRASIGRALRAHGWLLTPEETAPPPELNALQVPEPLQTLPPSLPLGAPLPALGAPLSMVARPPRYPWSHRGPPAEAPEAEALCAVQVAVPTVQIETPAP